MGIGFPLGRGTRMLHAIFAVILAIGPFPMAAAAADAQAKQAPATTQAAATTQPAPAPAAAAAATPTTQPVAVAVVTAEQLAQMQGDSITDVFSRTRMGQLFRGEKKVTLADVKDPVFWLDTVKDLVIA